MPKIKTQSAVFKQKIREIVEEIPEHKLSEVLDFLEYIRDRDEWEATWEILKDKEFLEGVKRGKKDILEGRWKRWEEIRKSV